MTDIGEWTLPSLDKLPLALTKYLNGEEGSNREKQQRCQIQAKNDYEALQCWLNEYRHRPATLRTYQKESERFLLWAVFQKKIALSSLNRDDLEEYIQFLDDPKPQHIWCAKKTGRGCKRGEAGWRPFTGPLGENAKATALSTIGSLLKYLVEARYLSFDPLSLIKKRHARAGKMLSGELTLQKRMLTLDEWEAMLDALENLSETNEKEKFEKARLNFLVRILFFLGLRINELATHTWNAFQQIENDWWFYVVGKGSKVGKIPVNDELLRAVITYRAYLKKTPFPSIDETAPLIATFKTEKPITARQINKLLKKLALETAKKFGNKPEKVNKLEKFSAHWLRHFSASMQDKMGVSFKHIRANHRHENDETTRRYVHAIDKERHEDMQKLKFIIKD